MAEIAQQEGARPLPVAPDGAFIAPEGEGELGVGQAGEEAAFDEPGELGIDCLQPVERAIECHDVHRDRLDACIRFQELDRHDASAALAGDPGPRCVDQDLAHRPRRQGEEVLAVLDGDGRPLRELEERLVHEDGGGERVARPALRPLATGERVQLTVDRGKGAFHCAAIAGARSGEQLGDGFVGHALPRYGRGRAERGAKRFGPRHPVRPGEHPGRLEAVGEQPAGTDRHAALGHADVDAGRESRAASRGEQALPAARDPDTGAIDREP